MTKTEKELAFLRDLYVSGDWTERFTTIVDKHLKLPNKGKMLYMNAGAGNHVLALMLKLAKKEVEIFCTSESKELEKIAEAKAQIVKANLNFTKSQNLEPASFDLAIANATFVRPGELEGLAVKLTASAKPGGTVAFFTSTSGSFGEIFSYLWEAFFESEPDRGAEVERLITDQPSVTIIEDLAEKAGLINIETHTKNEIFEYESGAEFIDSPLISYFLLPRWLDFLTGKQKEQAAKQLAQIIDSERDGLTFRFSVKATLLIGEKA